MAPNKAQGDGGAWVGGDWVPIEECSQRFLLKGKKTSGGGGFGECGGNCATCPRSRSRTVAAKADGSYDVVVIGAGVIGACVARELAKTKARVLLLEAADDVTQGATKGNSGIVHAGYDDKPGSVRAKFCNKGCRMFPALDEDLHFGFQRNGSLVLARGAEDEATLKRLVEQGEKNGVKNLRVITRDELFELEPHVNPDCTAALLAEDAGTVIPYELAIALAENAVDNGVELRIRREVVKIDKVGDKSGFVVTARHWEPETYIRRATRQSMFTGARIAGAVAACAAAAGAFTMASQQGVGPVPLAAACVTAFAATLIAVSAAVGCGSGGNGCKNDANMSWSAHRCEPSKGLVLDGLSEEEVIKCSHIVNCAGITSDKIANLVGDTSFQVNPRLGEYVLLDKKEGAKVGRTLFPCPGPMGKGVLVQNTLWGNLILGPTARDRLKAGPDGSLVRNDATEDESADSIVAKILSKCKELMPSFDAGQVIHTFAGMRAKTTRGDWIIEPCSTAPGMIHAAGIDSPGIAGAPAIALEVVDLLKAASCDPVREANLSFNPLRAPVVLPKRGLKTAFGNQLRYKPKAEAVKDPLENVVCKCEKVTEAEVVEALRRSLPIDSTQAIRKRTRAGMGHCQADPCNYDCEKRVAEIIARETGMAVQDVGMRPFPASSLLKNRFLDNDKDTKNHYRKLAGA